MFQNSLMNPNYLDFNKVQTDSWNKLGTQEDSRIIKMTSSKNSINTEKTLVLFACNQWQIDMTTYI